MLTLISEHVISLSICRYMVPPELLLQQQITTDNASYQKYQLTLW